jgi:hypothetical protein
VSLKQWPKRINKLTYFEELKMKKLLLVTALGLVAFAAGSEIKNSTISNKANIKNSQNMAIGYKGNATANQGSVAIKGSKVKNSTISNKANIKNSQNMAIGYKGNATANQGSIEIK